jgi:preprotein translocase subunit SecB
MRPASISLTTYFVRELQFKLNDSFERLRPYIPTLEDLEVTTDAVTKTEDRRSWELCLRLALNPAPERNSPYSFLIEIAGIVQVEASVKDENIERFVRINGTSLLFSAAREIVRAVTSRGPHGSILVPTVTFWEPKPQPAQEPIAEESVTSAAAGGGSE